MTKINKSTARKYWNEKKEFWITACNMRPVCGILIQYDRENIKETTFDKYINAFEYYNCDNQRGRYAAYYVEG